MRLHPILLCALILAACSQARAPINRVQPQALQKQFFVGKDLQSPSDDPEFYSQATIIDVAYGTSSDGLFTSTYSQPVSRIKWDIQEDQLVARLAYQRIENSDGKGAGAATVDGQIVAVYRIESHFDIERAYNPTTGEQLNVIEENTTDRPWYQREYMRVDWSQNLATSNYDFDTLASISTFGGATYEPVAMTVTNPTDPNAPHFETDAGYFDVTNKVLAKPAMIDLSMWGLGMFPSCFLSADFAGGGGPSANCNDTELTLRHSFRKVVDDDYEPQEWDGVRFKAFGAFTTERYGYARNYGMTDQLWHRMIDRYNIWERSHYYDDPVNMKGEVACYTPGTTPDGADPHRDVDNDGTEDECAAVTAKLAGCHYDATSGYDKTCIAIHTADLGGSQCDTFKQRCTLPFRMRQTKPAVWYYTESSNTNYWDGTRWATREWDTALREAVRTARYAECVRTTGDLTVCDNKYPVFHGQEDDAVDAVALVREVDACREGTAYQGHNCASVAETVGVARGYTGSVIDIAKADPMVVMCHSPVEKNDAPQCGNPRLPAGVTAGSCEAARAAKDQSKMAVCNAAMNAREGDLRYHHVNVIAEPQTRSPWGIMADASDPLTGEKLSSSINVWSYVTDIYSQLVVDQARYIKGELKTSDVTEGQNVREFSQAAESAVRGSAPKLTAAQIKEWTGALRAPGQAISKMPDLDPQMVQQVGNLVQQMRHEVQADATVASSNVAIYDARRQQALGTPFEAQLMTPPVQALAGSSSLSADVTAQLASPLRGANPTVLKQLRNMRELGLANRGTCILDQNEHDTPLAIATLADVLEAKFGNFDSTQDQGKQLARAEAMRQYVAQRYQYGVIIHEMGHSVGLRHNFVSSSDAFNYRPQYWQLRTEDGTKTTPCTDLNTPANCVGPRYFDPVNDNEKNNLIEMFMGSSVMEYPGETTQDMMGLGAYDFAAARMFYGDVATVYRGGSYADGTVRATGVIDKLDNFGGILGFQPAIGDPQPGNKGNVKNIHYSQLQKEYELIGNCEPVDASVFKPADWDSKKNGEWSPLIDGLIVTVGGQATRCRQQEVDYVDWNKLGPAGTAPGNTSSAMQVDPDHRVRVPYGFASDNWADTGNLSVYRHDNGADPYELFDFFVTQQEVGHIFDDYRRGRTTFAVRTAEERTLNRWNEKMKEAAKGLAFEGNFIKAFLTHQGFDADTDWPALAQQWFPDNVIAAQMGFDHFTRLLARPEDGQHVLALNHDFSTDGVFRSMSDNSGYQGNTLLTIPNGATGYYGQVAFGGKPIENALATDQGDYSSQYVVNAGSYYEKLWSAYLMSESEDQFISAQRSDFVDPRFRAYSMADLFPDGYRRWLGTNLTGDDAMKGPQVATDKNGQPLVDDQGYPRQGMGYVSWWRPDGPQACFSTDSGVDCTAAPKNTLTVDPEVGWEQQKFLVAFTLLYLPENQQRWWLDMIDLWEKGADSDPGFTSRIEFHDPTGLVYVARTFGKETVLGKTVQKGVSARVLEYANQLLQQGYVTNPGPDVDGDGQPDWYEARLNAVGQPIVRFDPAVQDPPPNCSLSDNSGCVCSSNRSCLSLRQYVSVPAFIRQGLAAYHLQETSMRGLN